MRFTYSVCVRACVCVCVSVSPAYPLSTLQPVDQLPFSIDGHPSLVHSNFLQYAPY
jgi:hypothetical protein